MSCGRESMTCRRAGVWSSRACRATLPFEGLVLCAFRCHARARLLGRGLPVGDDPPVGGLGLVGELALGGAHLLARRPGPGGRALARRRAGADLESAELLGGQRGLGGRSPRRARAATRTAPRACARPRRRRSCRRAGRGCAGRTRAGGLAARRPTRPPRRAPSARRASPAWRSVRPCGRRAAGLEHARVKPEVADQLARCRKAADVADRGQETRRADHVDARHR